MMQMAKQQNGLMDTQWLIQRIRQRLDGDGLAKNWGVRTDQGKIKGSAVLFLLTMGPTDGDKPPEPCLLLNKRSQKVLQPGDLCCPGGGVERFDRLLSCALHWPLSPLRKWPAWRQWKSLHPNQSRGLALLMTTALRECWEEMHLNPMKVAFMGPLPVQKLVLFNRQIYPLAGWVDQNQPLVPNWEVERIVHIPLRRLLDPKHYARYRLSFNTRQGVARRKEDFPCFIHHGRQGDEILWGATFRITMDFLKLVFGFQLPDLSDSPVIKRKLAQSYLDGK
jgi:8-oxo-dGTP pyrophosphatase MutT (NUDIX family)